MDLLSTRKGSIISNSNMGIFLHYLNREAYRAAGSTPSIPIIEACTKVLAIATTSHLISNFSNLLEGGYLSKTRESFIQNLLDCRQIQIYGERPSALEFIESRQPRYSFDCERYPMYFGTPLISDEITPFRTRVSSVTRALEDSIINIDLRTKSLQEFGISQSDCLVLNQIIPDISVATKRRENKAITLSLFNTLSLGQQQKLSTARLISSIYIKQYLDELDCDIATGIPGLIIFDSLARSFPTNNVQIFDCILNKCGFVEEYALSLNTHNMLLASLRNSSSHYALTQEISLLIDTLNRLYIEGSENCYSHYFQKVIGPAKHQSNDLEGTNSIFNIAYSNLRNLIDYLRNTNLRFSEEWEKQIFMDSKSIILLVTATDVETKALKESYEKTIGSLNPRYHHKDSYVASEIGEINGAKVIAVQCEPGSSGKSNSQAVVSDAIQDFNPSLIIMGGIAFGAQKDEQNIGDILIAKMIVEYEKAKVKKDHSIPRGAKIECSSKLLSIFRLGKTNSLTNSPVHIGTVLSGEKLLDSKEYFEKLLKQEPEAIGGEMEGVGLAAAAEREKKDWILIKGIVDWGYDKENNNESVDQHKTALNTFDFIFMTLQKIGF